MGRTVIRAAPSWYIGGLEGQRAEIVGGWFTALPWFSAVAGPPGSHVEVITPDAGSWAAMGTNQMDLAARVPAARAGFAQGKREAARMTLR